MKFLYDPPQIIKSVFDSFLWNTKNEEVLLTFDDGPNPGTTEKLLDLLKGRNIKALFFCLGENIERHPELCRRIIEEGHTIGNHTYSHKKINTVSREVINAEIEKTNAILKDKFNYDVKYFRPPHGRITFSTKKLLQKHNLINVMWSLLTWDYKGSFNKVQKSTHNYLKNNSIIVLHDSDKTKLILQDSVNLIIEEAQKRNLTIGDPINCLK